MAEKIKVDVGFLGTAMGAVTDDGRNAKLGARTERTLDKYEKMMQDGELIHGIQFAQGVKDKGLSRFEDDVEIFLPVEEVLKGAKHGYLSVSHFSRLYTVEVIDVDRDAKRVTVSFLKAQERVRPQILQQIRDAVRSGATPKTQARISYICDKGERVGSYAYVDILGLGIGGLLLAKDWNAGYVKDISKYARIGDVIECVITGFNPRKNSENYTEFLVSRKQLLGDDPWNSIEDRFPPKSRVIVTCIGTYPHNFIGKVDGLEEIAAYCYYPKPGATSSLTGQQIVIKEGGRYIGNVSKVRPDKKQLQVRIIDEVQPAGGGAAGGSGKTGA